MEKVILFTKEYYFLDRYTSLEKAIINSYHADADESEK